MIRNRCIHCVIINTKHQCENCKTERYYYSGEEIKKKLIDYEQCSKCSWNLSYGCSQQERRPKIGDVCPTLKELTTVVATKIYKEVVADIIKNDKLIKKWKEFYIIP